MVTWTTKREPTEPTRDVIVPDPEADQLSQLFNAERRRTLIARLYLSGLSMAKIAERIRTDEQTPHQAVYAVTLDLKRIREEWKESRIRDWNEEREKHLARIDALESTYWDAWYRSLDAEERVKTEYRESPKSTWKIGQTLRNEHPVGNMDALAGIERCQQERAKILGLYAPVKIAPTSPDGNKAYDPISDETRVALIAKAFIESGGGTTANAQSTRSAAQHDPGSNRVITGIARNAGTSDTRSHDS